MKLCYWRGDVPNFGDDLNPWLWPRLLPRFFDDDDATLFLGIGSILGFASVLQTTRPVARKVVFGSGYGGPAYGAPPLIDDSWNVYFVRGPQTAKALELNPRLGVGDPAILLGDLPGTRTLPRSTMGAAFMPHWESAADGSWQTIAELADVRYIDPRWSVERILGEIASSRILVTEAMHGAIVADALRVPWIPFAPIGRHHFKWHDWADSLGIDLHFAEPAPSTCVEALTRLFDGQPRIARSIMFHGRKHDLSRFDSLFHGKAVAALKRALRARPNMSTDAALASATLAMRDAIERLQADMPILRSAGYAPPAASLQAGLVAPREDNVDFVDDLAHDAPGRDVRWAADII